MFPLINMYLILKALNTGSVFMQIDSFNTHLRNDERENTVLGGQIIKLHKLVKNLKRKKKYHFSMNLIWTQGIFLSIYLR